MNAVSASLTTPPRSVPGAGSPVEAVRPSEPESFRERFLAALPLYGVGVACVAAAVYLYLAGAATTVGGNGSVHLRPWVLFVALGITGLSAGTICLFAEEEAFAPALPERAVAPSTSSRTPTSASPKGFGRPRPGYSGPTQEEWPTTAVTGELGFPASSGGSAPGAAIVPSRRPLDARVWDESALPPVAPHSDSKDAWDESSEEFAAAAAQPAPPEVVLHQLDELEASLRKKRVSPPSD